MGGKTGKFNKYVTLKSTRTQTRFPLVRVYSLHKM